MLEAGSRQVPPLWPNPNPNPNPNWMAGATALDGLSKTADAALIWLAEKARKEGAAAKTALKKAPVCAALLRDAGMHHESEVVATLGTSALELWDMISRVRAIVEHIEALMSSPAFPMNMISPHKRRPPSSPSPAKDEVSQKSPASTPERSERENRRRRRVINDAPVPREPEKRQAGLSDAFLRTANFMVRSRKVSPFCFFVV